VNTRVQRLFKRASTSKPQRKTTSPERLIAKKIETPFEKELDLEVYVENIQKIGFEVASADDNGNAVAQGTQDTIVSDHSPDATDDFLIETSASDDTAPTNIHFSFANQYDENSHQTTDTNDSDAISTLCADKEKSPTAADGDKMIMCK
jgi:hypothetical protein